MIGGVGRELLGRIADLLAGHGPEPVDIALVVELGRGDGDAVRGGHAVGGLVGQSVLGLRLGDGQLPLLLGGALLLQAGDLLDGPRSTFSTSPASSCAWT